MTTTVGRNFEKFAAPNFQFGASANPSLPYRTRLPIGAFNSLRQRARTEVWRSDCRHLLPARRTIWPVE
jgi:hypothetical protein